MKDLSKYLAYDPITGVITWIWHHNKSHLHRIGTKAGSIDGKGYSHINFDGKFYRSHRVAWFLYYGEWPKGVIDHINGDKLDNRITNLRDTTLLGNSLNRSSNKNAVSKLKGVSRHTHGRWQAQTKVNGKSYHLGLFDTEAEAHKAYCDFRLSLGDAEFRP